MLPFPCCWRTVQSNPLSHSLLKGRLHLPSPPQGKLIHFFLQFSHWKQLPLPHCSCSSPLGSIKCFHILLEACWPKPDMLSQLSPCHWGEWLPQPSSGDSANSPESKVSFFCSRIIPLLTEFASQMPVALIFICTHKFFFPRTALCCCLYWVAFANSKLLLKLYNQDRFDLLVSKALPCLVHCCNRYCMDLPFCRFHSNETAPFKQQYVLKPASDVKPLKPPRRAFFR